MLPKAPAGVARPLTGTARKQYLARALASPRPDLEDELEKLGFQGASELANSRARLRGHITSIHEQQIAPLPGSSRVSDYMPRAEPIGPGRKNAAADRRAEDEARLRGMDIAPTLQSAAKVTNTAGNIVMDVFNPVPSVAARIHGEDPGAAGYAADAAGFLPLVRGPRAIARGIKAAKAGAGVSAAVRAGRASLKETGPITRAARTFVAREGAVSIPAARSRSGRAVEQVIDKYVRPIASKAAVKNPDGRRIGPVLSEESRALHELGVTTRANQKIMRTTADMLTKYGRKLNDAEEYALRIIADGPSPAERVSFHMQQAVSTSDPAQQAYHQLHADVTRRAARYVTMVNDPKRGLVADLAPDAPENLRRVYNLFDEGGLQRESLLKDLGRIVDERIQNRIDANSRLITGGHYERPTPAKLGKPSPRLIKQREDVASLERQLARTNEALERVRRGEPPPAFFSPDPAALERQASDLSGALNVARTKLDRWEIRAEKMIKPTGFVGGRPSGRGYAPMWRGVPAARLAANRNGLVGLFNNANTLFGGAARTSVGAGPDDVHLKKAYEGSLLLSGLFTKDVVGPKVESLTKAVRMSAANQARKVLLEVGSDLPHFNTDVAVVVDPKRPIGYSAVAEARSNREAVARMWDIIDSAEAAGTRLGRRDLDAIDINTVEAAREALFPSSVDGRSIREIAEEALRERKQIPNLKWVSSDALEETGLLYVPAAARLARSGMAKRGRTVITATGMTWDGLNDFQKGMVTFLNPSYAPVNLTGNLVMNMMQQGVFMPRNIIRAGQMHSLMNAVQRTTIDNAMGSTMTSALTMRTTPGQFMQGTLGHWTSLAVDLQPRRLAFIHEAEKAGYSVAGKGGKKDLGRLLDAARMGDAAALSEMDPILRRAKDAIVDFDRISPWEREVLARWIFFYPWLRGASRYAIRFAADHPLQAAGIAFAYEHSQAAAQEQLGDRPFYAQLQIPVSTKSIGLKGPGFDVGLDDVVGDHSWVDADKNPMVINIRQLLTQTTPLELAQTGLAFFSIGPKGAAANAAQMLTPVPYAAGVAAFGYDPFTKQKAPQNIGTFLQQFGPTNSPLRDKISKLNMSAGERAAANRKSLNPRSLGQEVAKTFGSGLAPAPYSKDVGQRRALEGKPALERKWGTLLLDSEKYNVGTPPQEVFNDLATKVKIEKLAKGSDNYKEKAIAAATVFDEIHGTSLADNANRYETEAQSKWSYESLLPYLYPNYLAWERKIELAKANELAQTPAGATEPIPGR